MKTRFQPSVSTVLEANWNSVSGSVALPSPWIRKRAKKKSFQTVIIRITPPTSRIGRSSGSSTWR